jgi:ferritin-like metal-binding protein YciE
MAKTKETKYSTLHDLLILKLRVLHYVEGELIKALPKMAKAASDIDLKRAFNSHLEETRAQKDRLAKALKILRYDGKINEGSAAIDGLIKDAEWCIKNIKDGEARDASLIAAAQYVEHYEMAGYGSACAWAEEMGHAEVAELLQETLDEESAANEKLTTLAEGGINDEANDMHEEERDEEESVVDTIKERIQTALR